MTADAAALPRARQRRRRPWSGLTKAKFCRLLRYVLWAALLMFDYGTPYASGFGRFLDLVLGVVMLMLAREAWRDFHRSRVRDEWGD